MTAARQFSIARARRALTLAELACFAALVTLSLQLPARAQTSKPTEYDVKAAYLFNFGKFVKWPVNISSSDVFSICILGSDPFGSVLDSTVAGESIDGKRIVIRRISAASDALNCRIAFISSSEKGRVADIMAALAHAPVLTVSDIPHFAGKGMIQFVVMQDRVRFEVNLDAAEKAGLTLSSELLKVATSVKREGQAGR